MLTKKVFCSGRLCVDHRFEAHLQQLITFKLDWYLLDVDVREFRRDPTFLTLAALAAVAGCMVLILPAFFAFFNAVCL